MTQLTSGQAVLLWALAFLAIGSLVAIAVMDVWPEIRRRRAARAFDRDIDRVLLIVSDTPLFDETVASIPAVTERSVVDEAEAILRSAGGARG